MKTNNRTFALVLVLVIAAVSNAIGQQGVARAGETTLKNDIQVKLDEWHKAGKFPGATLGVVMKLVRCNDQPVAKLADSPGKTMCSDETFLAYLRQVFGVKN